MKQKQIKVFLGLLNYHGRQPRCIIGATSKKQAAELVGVSMGYFNGYFWENDAAKFRAVIDGIGVWADLENDSCRAKNFVKVKCINGSAREVVDSTVRLLGE